MDGLVLELCAPTRLPAHIDQVPSILLKCPGPALFELSILKNNISCVGWGGGVSVEHKQVGAGVSV